MATGELDRIVPRPGTAVRELLEHLNGGRRLPPSVGYGPDDAPARLAQRVVAAGGVEEHRGTEHDHARRPRSSVSSVSSSGTSGTSTGSASTRRRAAARRRSSGLGSPRSSIADDGSDQRAALTGHRGHPLIALLVQEELQATIQCHARTVACAGSAT